MLTMKGTAVLAMNLAMSTAAARTPAFVPATPQAPIGAAEDLPDGRIVAGRFFGLLADLNDWGDLSQEKIEIAMRVRLEVGRVKGTLSYLGHLRGGSSFFVNYYPATVKDHPYLSLNVSLSRGQRSSAACPIAFESVKQQFLKLGFDEAEVLNDIGSASSLQYTRGALTFNIDAITASSNKESDEKIELCLDSLTTI